MPPVRLGALRFRLPSPAMEGVLTSLEEVGTLLAERASKLGVRVRRGVPVSALTQEAGHVVVRAGEEEHAAGTGP
ncbi:hypothetical protein Acsp02_47520 [Actinoplanes sp. NBRC 103695]|nr:hypothetical protein Acsp02_47520 [Actinoplanes sp. NBRC 103695]